MEDKKHDRDESENQEHQDNSEKDNLQKHAVANVTDDSLEATSSEEKQSRNIPFPEARSQFVYFPVQASPPMFVSLEQIMQASNQFSNMVLAHEIAVNTDFKLQQKPVAKQSIEKQVADVVHKAFWDCLQEELNETPPNYSQAMVLLGEVKEGLMCVLLPQHHNLRRQINEALDLDLIQQQVDNDALDFRQYANFIISTLARLCAPARDETINELKSLTEIVPLYKGILETLDLMKLDMANFAIQQIRPRIQQHSVDYEKQKFAEFLKTIKGLTPPVDGLEETKKWLKSICEKIEVLPLHERTMSNSEIITKAFMEILQWDDDKLFPEALQMDKARYLALRSQFLIIVITASILLLTYSTVGESIQGISSLKQHLKDELTILLKSSSSVWIEKNLKEHLQSVEIHVIKVVNGSLVEHGFSTLCETKATAIATQIQEIGSTQHNVRKIITTRVLEFLENVLNSSNAASVKIPLGLSAFSNELSSLAGAFRHLVSHNRAVFGDYYVDILNAILHENSE